MRGVAKRMTRHPRKYGYGARQWRALDRAAERRRRLTRQSHQSEDPDVREELRVRVVKSWQESQRRFLAGLR